MSGRLKHKKIDLETEILNGLVNQEILAQILLTVDNVYLLGNCRQVCKIWKSIVDLPLFYELWNNLIKTLSANTILDGFFSICESGNLKMVQWFTTRYNIHTCKYNSSTKELQWRFVNIKGTYRSNGACSVLLTEVCRNGHFEMMKWLIKYTNMTIDSIRINQHEILRIACSRGYIHIVKWLVSHFNITNVRDYKFEILRSACALGHLEILKWLFQQVEFTVKDIRDGDNYALKIAHTGGHRCITQFLYTWLDQQIGLV